MRTILFFFSIVLLLNACQSDGTTNVKTYYFPLHDLYDGLVYEYEGVDDEQLPPYYWYYRTVEKEDGTVTLTGMYYNYAFEPQQFIQEERIGNGMILEDLFLYELNADGKQDQIIAEIVEDTVYPFEVRDSLGIFLYEVQWFSPSDSTNYTIVRNRRYQGKTSFTYQDKDYLAVRFQVRELIETEKEGFLTIEMIGEEIYAQGLGLVEVKKEAVTGSFKQHYRLVDRYLMTELEEKFSRFLEE